MKIFKKRYIVLSLLIGQVGFAQEGLSVYSEYLNDNYYLLHPAMAGVKNHTQLRGTFRQQWGGVEDAPQLQTLTANTRIGEQSGIGLIAFNDKNGYHSQMGAKVTYAHHISFAESRYELNQLSFGMSAGFARTTLDETKFGGFDPNISGGVEIKDSYFSVDFGAAYHYNNFFSMLTVKNAISSQQKLYSDAESNNLRKYLLGMGYAFGDNRYNDGWTYEPSLLFQYSEKTQEKTIDANMKVYKAMSFGKLYGGASYRRSFDGTSYSEGGSSKTQYMQYISPFLGVNYKSFNFGYVYSHVLGDKTFDKAGYHQVTVGFNLFPKRSSLDCNCPTVKD
ncbi:MAG: type IX secretion system membrane protein PorP/SprF [Flavobacteriaceae bacterium]|jgi:type IX secretion system PorP/SprF family membrane protein|nr:type IX secretion system membrane protein PorP/SprF [Flavobacteriaceae bacterium]